MSSSFAAFIRISSLVIALGYGAISFGKTYTFVKVADNAPTSQFSGLGDIAVLNNSGKVAFVATQRDGTQAFFVWAPDGTVTKAGSATPDMDDPQVAAFNNSGVLLIWGRRSQTLHTLGADGKPVSIYTRGSGEGLDGSTGTPAMNDSGTVALSTGRTILTITGPGAIQTLVSDTDLPRVNAFLPPTIFGVTINKSGAVAFTALNTGLPGCNICVYRVASGQRTQIGDTSITTKPVINDQGDVVYYMSTGNKIGIYTGNGGPPTLLVDLSDRKLSPFSSVPSFNSSGTVAFQASGTSPAPFLGIYTGANPVDDKVIAIGDALLGSAVGLLPVVVTQSGRLNDSGQIVFHYTLSNGLSGIAVATPVSTGTSGAPILPANSITNAASFLSATPSAEDPVVAPGAVISLFGTNFASALTQAAGTPLPASLAGTSVTVNGAAAPLFFVAPTQINAQVPYDTPAGNATVQVKTAAGVSETRTIAVGAQAPAVYSLNQSGKGQGVVVFANTATLVAPLGITVDSRPARAGDAITIYANSLGAVSPAIPAGWNSCAQSICTPDLSNLTLRRTDATPQIAINGVVVPPSQILFSGLAPQFAGLYQINLIVPSGIPPRNEVPLSLIPPGKPIPNSSLISIAVQ